MLLTSGLLLSAGADDDLGTRFVIAERVAQGTALLLTLGGGITALVLRYRRWVRRGLTSALWDHGAHEEHPRRRRRSTPCRGGRHGDELRSPRTPRRWSRPRPRPRSAGDRARKHRGMAARLAVDGAAEAGRRHRRGPCGGRAHRADRRQPRVPAVRAAVRLRHRDPAPPFPGAGRAAATLRAAHAAPPPGAAGDRAGARDPPVQRRHPRRLRTDRHALRAADDPATGGAADRRRDRAAGARCLGLVGWHHRAGKRQRIRCSLRPRLPHRPRAACPRRAARPCAHPAAGRRPAHPDGDRRDRSPVAPARGGASASRSAGATDPLGAADRGARRDSAQLRAAAGPRPRPPGQRADPRRVSGCSTSTPASPSRWAWPPGLRCSPSICADVARSAPPRAPAERRGARDRGARRSIAQRLHRPVGGVPGSLPALHPGPRSTARHRRSRHDRAAGLAGDDPRGPRRARPRPARTPRTPAAPPGRLGRPHPAQQARHCPAPRRGARP